MIIKLKKAILNCAIVLLAGSSTASIAAPPVPKEIEQFLAADMTLIDYQEADLNADGKADALIVVEKTSAADPSISEPRTVFILLRNEKDQLAIAAQNNEAYFCKKCLGSGYVNEQVLKASQGTFSVFNQGGSPSLRWTREYTFQYISNMKNWQLTEVNTGVFSTIDNEKFKTKKLTYPKHLKKINFSKFSVDKKWNPAL